MPTGFKVTAAAVVLPTEDGSERYLYRSGAVLAAKGYTPKGLKHALEAGLIEKAELVDVEAEAAAEAERVAAEQKAAEEKAAAEAKREADEKAAAEKAEAERLEAEKKAAEEAAAKAADASAKPGTRGNAQTAK